jgi:AraC family transcriptional regulator
MKTKTPPRRVDPWPLPIVPSSRSVANGARTSLVHDGGSVQIVSWACRRDCEELRSERTHSHHVVSLLRRGACTIRQGRFEAVTDSATIVEHRAGATYRTGHPFGFIDAGWSLAYDDAIAAEILDACGAPRWPDRPTRLVHAPRLRLRARAVTTLFRLECAGAVDPIQAQEAALDLLARLHDPDAFAWSPSDPARAGERRLVDRACESMRARLGEAVRFADVARDAGCSEFRLYRAFRRQRGTTPGGYLRHLRLAAVLDGLSAGAESLTELALATGFSHHSHMSATFRAQLGRTPQDVRGEIARDA